MKEFAEGPWGDYWQIIRKIKIDKGQYNKIPGLRRLLLELNVSLKITSFSKRNG